MFCGAAAFLSFQLYAAALFGFLDPPWVFPYILSVRVLQSVFSSPVYTMIAASCLDSFSTPLDRQNFGKDRLWGAISWGSVHVVIGHIIDATGGSFTVLFPAAFFFFVFFVLACRHFQQPQISGVSGNANAAKMRVISESESDTASLVSGTDAQDDNINVQKQRELRQKMSIFRILYLASVTVFGSVSAVVFFLNLFFINIGTTVVEGLVFMFFKNDLGASSTVLGWSVVVTVLFEIPLMYWAPRLLKRFSTGTLIVAAEFSYSIRTLVYTLVGTNTWLLLLVEPLHGVTYALLATSTTEHVASVVSPDDTCTSGLQTSAQSLLGVIGGVASIVGNAGGGWIMQTYGSSVLYRTTSAMVLCSALLFISLSAFIKSSKAQNNSTVD